MVIIRLIIFLSALLLAGVFGLTIVAVFTSISNFILSVVLAVIFAIFIIVAISVAISAVSKRHRDC